MKARSQLVSGGLGKAEDRAIAKFNYNRLRTIYVGDEPGYNGGGTVDTHDAIISATAKFVANGGGRLVFPFGDDCQVYSTLSGSGGSPVITTLMNITSLPKGGEIDFNGTKFHTDATFSDGKYLRWMTLVDDVRGLKINKPNFRQTNQLGLEPTLYGSQGINIIDRCEDIEIFNYDQDGGRYGIACFRGAAYDAADRTRGIRVYGGTVSNNYYPFSLQACGDDVEVRGWQSKKVGRDLHSYNVKGLYYQSKSTAGGEFNNWLGGVYCNAADPLGNLYADIELHLQSLEKEDTTDAHTNGSIFRLFLQQLTASTAAGRISNVTVNLDVENNNGATKPQPPGIHITKNDHNSAADTTQRGHVIEGLRFRGSLRGYDYGRKAVDAFAVGTWNEVVGCDFSELAIAAAGSYVANTSGSRFDLAVPTGADTRITFSKIKAPNVDITPTGFDATKMAMGEAVNFKNFFTGEISVTPVLGQVSGTGPNLGSTGTIVGRIKQDGWLRTFSFSFAFGGTGISAGDGANDWKVTPPSPYAQVAVLSAIGEVYALDTGTANHIGQAAIAATQDYVRMYKDQAATGFKAAAPFTWATGDAVRGQVQYHIGL